MGVNSGVPRQDKIGGSVEEKEAGWGNNLQNVQPP
jgi:hypothetical protein